MFDGELHGGLDALTDVAHQRRFVHRHQHHDRDVLGFPGCVRTVPRVVVAHLSQGGLNAPGGQEQASGQKERNLPPAAAPAARSHAAPRTDKRRRAPAHWPGIVVWRLLRAAQISRDGNA